MRALRVELADEDAAALEETGAVLTMFVAGVLANVIAAVAAGGQGRRPQITVTEEREAAPLPNADDEGG